MVFFSTIRALTRTPNSGALAIKDTHQHDPRKLKQPYIAICNSTPLKSTQLYILPYHTLPPHAEVISSACRTPAAATSTSTTATLPGQRMLRTYTQASEKLEYDIVAEHVHMYVYAYMQMYTYHTYVSMCICIYMYIYIYVYIYNIHVCTYVHINVRVYIYIYIFVYLCVFTHHVCVCIHVQS